VHWPRGWLQFFEAISSNFLSVLSYAFGSHFQEEMSPCGRIFAPYQRPKKAMPNLLQRAASEANIRITSISGCRFLTTTFRYCVCKLFPTTRVRHGLQNLFYHRVSKPTDWPACSARHDGSAMDWLAPTRFHRQTTLPDKEKSKSAGAAGLLRTAERPRAINRRSINAMKTVAARGGKPCAGAPKG
jgi:hypothetical protein